jgi:hypothetical protein
MNPQYNIANETNEAALIQFVTQAMQNGWQPIGGVAVVPVGVANGQQVYAFLQAMVHA